MRNWAIVTAVALGLAAGPAAWATGTSDPTLSAPSDAAVGAEQARLDATVEKASNGVRTGLVEDLRGVVDDPAFASLPGDSRFLALKLLGAALYDAKDMPGAHAALVRATQLDEADQETWTLRFYSADDADKAENLLCLTVIANRWPEALGDVGASYVADLIHDTRDKPELAQARLQAMEALRAAKFTDQTITRDLVDAYLDQGQLDRAVEAAGSITEPNILVGFHLAKRYDALISKAPDHLDIAHAQSAYLAGLRAAAAAQPASLSALNDVIEELIQENRPLDALPLIEDANARIKAASPDHPAFSDLDKSQNWLEDHYSAVLFLLGRNDEGVAALTLSASLPENGGPNVSDTINLGDVLDGLNRPKEALATVAKLTDDRASPFGRMQAWDVRACSYALLGDKARYAAELKLLRDHEDDAPGALEQVLVCANDLDGAAAVLVHRLSDTKLSNDALLEVQTNLQPAHEPVFNLEMDHRMALVTARPEVKAAIAAAGHVIAIPRLGPGY